MAFNNTTVLSVPMTLAPASLTHAIAFLTRPLLPALAPEALALLQTALRRALAAAYVPNRASRLVLGFAGSGAPPPRPVHAACRAAGVSWAAWRPLLPAHGAFAVVIEPRVVSVAYPASGLVPAQSAVVWSEAAAVPRRLAPLSAPAHTAAGKEETHVRISKARVQAPLRTTLHSALARSQTRGSSTTLAQRLLAVGEKKEADELFAMLYTSVLSPTPTRGAFPVGVSPSIAFSRCTDDKAASPSPSPSSSRSSTPSSFGSAYDSDAESLTSASSASSFDFLDSAKPSCTTAAPVPVPAAATRPVPAFARRVPAPAPAAFVPRPSPSLSTPFTSATASTPAATTTMTAAPARVWIDSTKKDVTKYLYQGGVSTVLTGGVMLGGGAAAARPRAAAAATSPKPSAGAVRPRPTARAAADVPKYRAPIGSGRWGAPALHGFSAAPAVGAGSWRRAARV
ncbi:hypothetical protein BJ912DRAFT_485872 [Pholiota molesta]|nr:hypothetical protein BJ912DRAFT_485872 [Pholiota molesta]